MFSAMLPEFSRWMKAKIPLQLPNRQCRYADKSTEYQVKNLPLIAPIQKIQAVAMRRISSIMAFAKASACSLVCASA